jgi:hypothetical protein
LCTNSVNAYAFLTYDGAVDSDDGQLYYNTTGSSAGSLKINAYVVRAGLSSMPTTQT